MSSGAHTSKNTHTLKQGARTLAYKAPELFGSNSEDSDEETNADSATFTAACDVYAYGVVLWEITSGGVPWAGLNEVQLIRKVMKGNRPTMPREKALQSFLDTNFVEWIEWCWQQEPADRPSFADLCDYVNNMPQAMLASGMGEVTKSMPADTDFLTVFSTMPGYQSWRDTSQGSWMMSTLAEELEASHQTEHLVDILTATNNRVSRQVTGGNGQVMQKVDQLTKKLYLRTGVSEGDYVSPAYLESVMTSYAPWRAEPAVRFQGGLPTSDIYDWVRGCRVLFSFGSRMGGLHLAKYLQRLVHGIEGWPEGCAYIDMVNLREHPDTHIEDVVENGDQFTKVLNPHWAEFYFMALLVCHTVTIVFDEAWRESQWAQGEWQLFLKNSLARYIDCYGREASKYKFMLIVVYHTERTDNAEVGELRLKLRELLVSQEMMENVRFIPANVASFQPPRGSNETNTQLSSAADRAFLEAVRESSDAALRDQDQFAARTSRTQQRRVTDQVVMDLYDKDWRDLAMRQARGQQWWNEMGEELMGQADEVEECLDFREGDPENDSTSSSSDDFEHPFSPGHMNMLLPDAPT